MSTFEFVYSYDLHMWFLAIVVLPLCGLLAGLLINSMSYSNPGQRAVSAAVAGVLGFMLGVVAALIPIITATGNTHQDARATADKQFISWADDEFGIKLTDSEADRLLFEGDTLKVDVDGDSVALAAVGKEGTPAASFLDAWSGASFLDAWDTEYRYSWNLVRADGETFERK